ncbi:MAG: hypothetical protein NVS2B15_19740 [Pseudarthrobacter sp.]
MGSCRDGPCSAEAELVDVLHPVPPSGDQGPHLARLREGCDHPPRVRFRRRRRRHVDPGAEPGHKRSNFTSIPELEAALRRYIENYNQDATPSNGTKGADYLLGKMKLKETINTEH